MRWLFEIAKKKAVRLYKVNAHADGVGLACLTARRLAMPEKRTKFESASLLCFRIKDI